MKLCKACKYSKLDTDFIIADLQSKNSICKHPKNVTITISPVDGKEIQDYKCKRCRLHRKDTWLVSIINKTCGKTGYWFEEK